MIVTYFSVVCEPNEAVCVTNQKTNVIVIFTGAAISAEERWIVSARAVGIIGPRASIPSISKRFMTARLGAVEGALPDVSGWKRCSVSVLVSNEISTIILIT